MTGGRRRFLIAFAALAVAVVAFLILFDWNWLKGPLERQISSRLGRPFQIAGDLEVDLGLRPRITVEKVRLANPDWASDEPMVAVERAEFVVDLPALWRGRIVLPEVNVSAPALRLETRPDGPPNWQLKQGPDEGPPTLPEIGRLQIAEASVTYLDHGVGRTVDARLEEVAGSLGSTGATLNGKGEVAGRPLELKLEAPSLAPEGPSGPYQLALDLRLGESDLAGNVELDLQRDVPAVRAKVHSRRLATGELAGLLGTAGAAAAEASTPSAARPAGAPEGGLDRLQSVLGGLDLEQLPELEAELDYRIDQFEAPDLTLQQVQLRAGLHERLPRLALEGKGSFKGGPIALDVEAGPAEGAGPAQPRYRVDAQIAAGETEITASGGIDDPERLQGIDLKLATRSPDLAQALRQLGIDIPPLPGLQLAGQLVREGEVWRLDHLDAKAGESDLAGRVEVNLSRPRPMLAADLRSKQLRVVDLLPTPAEREAVKEEVKEEVAELLPAIFTPTGINFEALPKVDADVEFQAEQLAAPAFVFDQLKLDLKLRERIAVIDATGRGQFGDFEPMAFEAHAGDQQSLANPEGRYPIELALQAGDSRASAKGSVYRSLDYRGLDVDVALEGPGLKELGQSLKLSLPVTPPYDIKGKVTHEADAQRWNLVAIRGTIGDSDVGGDISLELTSARPTVVADLRSKRLDFDDLGVVVGAPPDTQPGETASAAQRQQAAAAEARPHVLPDKPLSLPDLQAVDARIKFAGEKVQARMVPLEQLKLEATLQDGKLHIEPMRLEVAGGELEAVIDLANSDPGLEGSFDLSLKQIKLTELLSRLNIELGEIELEKEGVGAFGGRAKLTARGASVHDLAASADGEIALVMGGGQINALIIEGLGLDVGEALGLIISEEEEGGATMVPMQCAITRFDVQDGLMRVQALVLETSDSTITGKGQVDLGEEAMALELLAHPKDASMLTASTPVRIEGTFKEPKVDLISEELKAKSLAALALGVILPVVGAILPFFEPGETKDTNCGQLIKAATAAMPPPPSETSE